jgi:hypothetical protein
MLAQKILTQRREAAEKKCKQFFFQNLPEADFFMNFFAAQSGKIHLPITASEITRRWISDVPS